MTATEIQELRQEAFDARKRAEALLVAAGKSPLSEEQDKEVDDLIERAEALDKNRKRAESLLAIEKADAERAAKERDKAAAESEAKGEDTPAPSAAPAGRQLSAETLERRAFAHWIKTGSRSYTHGDQTYSMRDATASIDTEGGYLAAPMTILSEVLKEVDDMVYMRQIGRRLPSVPPNSSLGVPFSNNSTLQAQWSAELTSADPSAVEFQGREFRPAYLTYRIFISRSLIAAANVVNIEQYVRSEMAIRVAEVMEQAYLLGTGVRQPLGLFVDSNDGIPAGNNDADRNQQTAVANKVGYDDIINVFFKLKGQYMRNATWFLSRTFLREVAKIKDSDGRPIWRTGLAPADPQMLLNRPIVMSEFAPAYKAGEYGAVVGDFSKYWIADSTLMDVIRQTEKWAERNQIAIVGRQQSDGAPALSEAFARLKVKS